MWVNHVRIEQVLSVSLRLLDLLEVPEEGQRSYRLHLSRSFFAILYWCFPLQGVQSVEIRQQLVQLLPFEHKTRYWRCWRCFTDRNVSLEKKMRFLTTYGDDKILALRLWRSCSSRTVICEIGLLLGLGAGRKPGIVDELLVCRRGEEGEANDPFITGD